MATCVPRLKTFVVTAWALRAPASSERVPLRTMRVQAIDGYAAAATYARCTGTPRALWDDGSASPPVVIRAEAA